MMKRNLKTKIMKVNHCMTNMGNGIKAQHILTPHHQQVLDGIWVKEQTVKSMSMKGCRLQMEDL